MRDSENIWKFMDLEKFCSLLKEKALYHASLRSLKDPCEGALRKDLYLAKTWREKFPNPNDRRAHVRILKEKSKQNRSEIAVSCWHKSRIEPESFWKLYTQLHSGIAIKSNRLSLIKAIQLMNKERKVEVFDIKYFNDTELDNYQESSLIFSEFVKYKRIQFKHENELRTQIRINPKNEGRIYPYGEHIPICLSTLIKEVVISPYAEQWIKVIVQDLMEKYKLNSKLVRTSTLVV